MTTATKTFEVREHTEDDGMYHIIEVWFQGNFVEMICNPTMTEARRILEERGYKLQFPLMGG